MMSALWFSRVGVLVLATSLDFLIGDPWGWPHPVQVMGKVIHWGMAGILRLNLSAWGERVSGALLGLVVVVG
ncbi:MAG: cobalamin biosynthesis protein [Leptolyngbyaceae cyanobacterium SM2_5_2]|nr:cobalamin biosynthesis protein [Leptolyngbyaceae cyanobacterium SM2_5_2]